jgi:hypothetical protein
MPSTPLKSARRRACGHGDDAHASPTCPQEQKQKKRTVDVLPKPDKLIRYRQQIAHAQSQMAGRTIRSERSRACPLTTATSRPHRPLKPPASGRRALSTGRVSVRQRCELRFFLGAERLGRRRGAAAGEEHRGKARA